MRNTAALAAVALLALLLYYLAQEDGTVTLATPGNAQAQGEKGAGIKSEQLVRTLQQTAGSNDSDPDHGTSAKASTVRGRVVDAEQRPVMRFSTLIWEKGRRSPTFVREWMGGVFELGLDRIPGGFSIIPEIPSYGDRVHVPRKKIDAAVEADKPMLVVVPRPDPGLQLVAGVVVDERGLGVPGATVNVSLLKGGDTGNIGYCVADAKGRFRRRFPLSQYGECYVSLRAAHHVYGVSEPQLRRTRGGDVICEKPLVIPRLTPVVFRFLDRGGRIVDGLQISISNGPTWTRSAVSDNEGKIRIKVPRESLIYSKRSLLGSSRFLRHDIDKHGRDRVITVRRSATLIGKVVDHRGKPARAQVELRAATGMSFLQTIRAQKDGSFTFRYVPGHCRLIVRAYSALQGATSDIHVVEPGDVRPLSLVYTPKMIIRLRVKTPKGLRVGRVMSIVRDKNENLVYSSEVPLDEIVNCCSLPLADYTVHVNAPGYGSELTAISARSGASPLVEIALAPVDVVHVTMKGFIRDWPSEAWTLEQVAPSGGSRFLGVVEDARVKVGLVRREKSTTLKLVAPNGEEQGSWTGELAGGGEYLLQKGTNRCVKINR